MVLFAMLSIRIHHGLVSQARNVCTWASSLSLELLVDMQMNATAGNITQIRTPMVDPTRPRTSSILGVMSPTVNDADMIAIVRNLNLVSGM